MPDVDEFDDFEDVVLEDNPLQEFSLNADSLLKAPTNLIDEHNDENIMKTEIQDLIDQTDNKEIIEVLEFIKDFSDDKNSWRILAGYLKSSPLEFARKGFNLIFNRFPCSGTFVRMYCEIEESKGNNDIVIETLKKYIPYCVNIDLWVYCCNFYKKILLDGKVGHALLAARRQVEEIFSYAVESVGFFVDSTDLWVAYLDFLKDYSPPEDRIGEYNLQRRKFYHRVVTIPLDWLEEAWSSYRVFEESVSRGRDEEEIKEIASRQIQLVDDKHNLAKEILKERSVIWQYITDDNLPMRVLTDEAKEQVNYWVKFIKYEKQNPMKLPREQLYHQLHMTYLRCLSCCYYCPDMWLSFAQFEAEYDWEKALQVIQAALRVMPQSVLLRLAFCDFLEETDHVDQAEREYEEIVQKGDVVGWIQFMKFKRRRRGREESREFFLKAVEVCKQPELFVAAADIEKRINHDEDAGLNVFRLGMKQFADNTSFIMAFVDYLLSVQQTDLAIQLLEQSIDKVKKEEKSLIWERLILVNARYRITSPIDTMFSLQTTYNQMDPSNQNTPGVVDISRYMQWGGLLQSPIDKSMLKRRYPHKKKEVDEIPMKVFEIDLTSNIPEPGEPERRRIPLPEWLEFIYRKLPAAGQKNSRGNEVDKLVEVLKKIRIPGEEKLQLY